jgi:hypothetical protein
MHRVELHSDGHAVMLDHNDAMVNSFVVFGAAEPKCLELKKTWEEFPIVWILEDAGLSMPQQQLLACDWAEHVLPIFERSSPDDSRPRVGLAQVRDYWWLKTTKVAVRAAMRLVERARNSKDERLDSGAYQAAYAVLQAGAWASAVVPRGTTKKESYQVSADAADATATRARWAASAAGTLRADELRWQLEWTFRVLKTLEEGEPWPAM